MVLFPEGGFLRKRLQVSQKYAEKNNLPMLKNVTLPRVGALKAIFEVLPPQTTIGNNNATKRTENGTLRSSNSQGNIKLKISIQSHDTKSTHSHIVDAAAAAAVSYIAHSIEIEMLYKWLKGNLIGIGCTPYYIIYCIIEIHLI